MFTWRVISCSYIDSDDEEEDYFTLAEIKEKLEEEGSWKTSIFEGGLDDIEIERIEKHLESHAVKEDIDTTLSSSLHLVEMFVLRYNFGTVFLRIPVTISWMIKSLSVKNQIKLSSFVTL